MIYFAVKQERAKERQQKEQLEKELKEKDKQLQELLNHHQQVRHSHKHNTVTIVSSL